MSLRLYEIVGSIMAIEDEIVASGGEITEEISAKLDAMEGTLESKVEVICHVITNLDGFAAAVKLEEARLAARRKTHETGSARLKRYLFDTLVKLDRDTVETAVVKVSLQNSPASVNCTATALELPDEYVRIVPESREVDKSALLSAWKAKKDLPEGVTVTQSKHLRIR